MQGAVLAMVKRPVRAIGLLSIAEVENDMSSLHIQGSCKFSFNVNESRRFQDISVRKGS